MMLWIIAENYLLIIVKCPPYLMGLNRGTDKEGI